VVLTTRGNVTGVVEPAAAEPHVLRELDWYWSDHVFHTPRLTARLAMERHNHRVLRSVLHDVRPEVVSAWHMGGMSLSLLTTLEADGRPVVLNICDEWPVYAPVRDAWSAGWSRLPRWARRLGGRVTGLPTTLPDLDRHAASVVSDYTLATLRQRSAWSFPRATVVGSGVDTTDFPVAAAAAERPWRGELLAVGRVEPRKGFDTAVAALEHLPAMQLRILGVADPEHLRDVRQLAARCGASDRVTVEALPRRELRAAYAAADAVLFPSRWQEPFGLVPLEAMTQRTPVVATRRGGSAEFLVDGENCLEIPADDPVALAAAVQRLAEQPALRARLVAGGLATAAEHTIDRLADRLEVLHRQASDAHS
jgi:glycosyltransferase involved in cell wall biosynthesis